MVAVTWEWHEKWKKDKQENGWEGNLKGPMEKGRLRKQPKKQAEKWEETACHRVVETKRMMARKQTSGRWKPRSLLTQKDGPRNRDRGT